MVILYAHVLICSDDILMGLWRENEISRAEFLGCMYETGQPLFRTQTVKCIDDKLISVIERKIRTALQPGFYQRQPKR